ncbi:hypothetical protein Agub_g31, partial [Astrephomene gubernaculifera]
MVFGREAAVVVKGRDGRTVLIQSRGIDMHQAGHAASEAMTLMQASNQGGDPWDILSSTQGAPMMCGRLNVMHNKFAVTYRVAGGLVLLLVTPPAANALGCVQLLGGLLRVVGGGAGGGGGGWGGGGEGRAAAELVPERVHKRFGEVFLAVEALLGSYGVLDPPAATARALASLDAIFDKAGGADKAADKADKGGGGKAAAAAAAAADKGLPGPESPRTPPAGGGRGRSTRRTLQGVIDQLALLAFPVGGAMQGVAPRPGFQLPEGGVAAAHHAMAAAGGRPRDPFAPVPLAPAGTALPGPSASSAELFGEDDIFGLGGGAAKAAAAAKQPTATAPAAAAAKAAPAASADPNDPFAASDPFAPAPAATAAGDASWTSFGGAAAADAAGNKAPAAAAAATKTPAVGFEDNAFGAAADGFGD